MNAIIETHDSYEELRETKDYLEKLIDSANAPIIVWDPCFRITRFNGAFENLTGRLEDEVLGINLDFLFPPGQVDSSMRLIKTAQHEEQWKVVEIDIQHLDGTIRTVLWNSANIYAPDGKTLVSTIAQGQDITQRKKMEKELAHSQLLLRASIESQKDTVLFSIDSNYHYLYFNKAHADVMKFAYGADIKLDMNVLECITSDEDRIKAKENYDRALAGESFTNVRRYGDIHFAYYESFFNPILNDSREIIGATALARDITDRVRNEENLIQSIKQAQAATIAKSQFLANMSHEIRTPMNGMLGMLQLLAMTPLTGEQSEYVRISRTCADTLLVLINDVLDFSKIEAGKVNLEKISFSMNSLLNEVRQLFILPAANKSLVLEFIMENDVPDQLVGDPHRLKQVLTNLIGNAIKFTGEGRIDFRARKLEIRDHHDIVLEFSVRDTGIGIPEDKLGLLFQNFSQVDSSETRKYGGTGLGLAISRSLVEMMDGKIQVESKEGVGSCFRFTCVMTLAESGQEANGENPSMMEQNGKKTGKNVLILLADDDESCRKIIRTCAMKKGWKVVTAVNGKEALDAFRKSHFDAVVMDVRMPVINGIDATGVIRLMEAQTDRHTPVIAITANAMEGDRDRCLEAGMDDYLAKPLNMEKFCSVMQGWIKNT